MYFKSIQTCVFHLGNVNAMTINDKENWSFVSSREKDYTHDSFE